jgi:small subunit ribosomal protein S1
MSEPIEDEEGVEGTIVEAAVLSVAEDHVVVHLGGAGEGVIALADFKQKRSDEPKIEVGDSFPVYIDHLPDDGERYVASRDKAMRMLAFDKAKGAFEKNETVEGEIVATVEGGFNVDVGVKAFLPASQFGLHPLRSPNQVLGHRFQFKIIRFNEARHNIVVSRRVLLEAEREAILDRVQVGAIIEGRVKSLVDYGAFIDVGGIDGLLHNSDISWGRVKHPSEVLAVGDPVTVKVLKFDRKKRKLSLGLRQIQEDPWLTAGDRYPLGSEVEGLVISKTDYGVFIEIEPGVEGLVHSTGPLVPDAAKETLKKVELGERIKAKVLDLDLPKKRMSLGLAS